MDEDLYLLKKERTLFEMRETKKKENERLIKFKLQYKQLIEESIEESLYLNILIGYFHPLDDEMTYLIFKIIKKREVKIFQNIYAEIIKYDTKTEQKLIEKIVIQMMKSIL